MAVLVPNALRDALFRADRTGGEISGVKNYHVSVKETGGGIAFSEGRTGRSRSQLWDRSRKARRTTREVIERAREWCWRSTNRPSNG